MPTLSIDGSEIFYKEAGAGPPLLLIHGTSVDADTWGECFDALAESHRVVAYDRRGHSRSRAGGATADWERHTSDAVAVMEQLELGPAPVVGWSGGGVVALKLALRRPDLLTSLVLAEPAFEPSRNVTFGFVRQFLAGQMLARLGREVAGYERFIRFVTSRRDGVSTWDDPAFPEERREVGRANAGAWRVESAARRGQASAKEVAAIQAPTTVIVGGQTNPWFERMAGAAVDAIPDARLVRIPNANHAMGFTAPRELAEAIRAAVTDASRDSVAR